jgi:hypothetical protein
MSLNHIANIVRKQLTVALISLYLAGCAVLRPSPPPKAPAPLIANPIVTELYQIITEKFLLGRTFIINTGKDDLSYIVTASREREKDGLERLEIRVAVREKTEIGFLDKFLDGIVDEAYSYQVVGDALDANGKVSYRYRILSLKEPQRYNKEYQNYVTQVLNFLKHWPEKIEEYKKQEIFFE